MNGSKPGRVGRSFPVSGIETNVETKGNGGSVVMIGIADKWVVVIVLLLFVLALAFSVWAIVRTGDALDEARRATDVTAHLEREYRLAQEDLMMLRNVMRANGITVETAGEHQ